MKVLQRYFAREVWQAVMFVLFAFLALFAFIELSSESKAIGRGEYQMQHAMLFVLSGLPAWVYSVMPIAALIGTIYALAQLAARSEFTIMRASSMSTFMAGRILFKIGVVFALITFVFGEFIAPSATSWGQKMKLGLQDKAMNQEFRSGLWTKDIIKQNGLSGAPIGTRFLNVREARPDGQLLGIKLYEFNQDFRLQVMLNAERAEYMGKNVWRLMGVQETRFDMATSGQAWTEMQASVQSVKLVNTNKLEHRDVVSEITPQLMKAMFASDPEKMSAYDLALYTSHLEENRQYSQRYEIAFWKKLTYPLAVFVMMALALPFAYLHVRSGGVSLKIFIGIMIGVGFHLVNSLFSTLGVLNTWPALFAAIAPSLLFFILALAALWWVERH